MPENTITLETAQKWAANWRSNPDNVYAHLIPMIDFTKLSMEKDVANIRGYMGIDEKGKNKLMLVGIDSNGKDLIDSSKEQYIYDFTTPCPNTCDIDSPLFTLKF